MNDSGSSVSTSMSNTSISANVFNNNPLPSITGLLANGPILPKPNTAVPLDITATKFAFDVYLYANSTLAISKHGKLHLASMQGSTHELLSEVLSEHLDFSMGFAS